MNLLTLDKIKRSPELISTSFKSRTGKGYVIRPLLPEDVDELTAFLESLSPLTRHRWYVEDYGYQGAKDMCNAIARYDKLRLVVVETEKKGASIAALMEFSLDMPSSDVARFARYDIDLSAESYIRIGPCVRDDLHREGIFSAVAPVLIDIAHRFGRSSIILWGGVLCDNIPAVKAYEKVGFYQIGTFNDPDSNDRRFDMILDIVS